MSHIYKRESTPMWCIVLSLSLVLSEAEFARGGGVNANKEKMGEGSLVAVTSQYTIALVILELIANVRKML